MLNAIVLTILELKLRWHCWRARRELLFSEADAEIAALRLITGRV